MENENNKETKTMTANQEILIKKLLKSGKFKDSEYRELRNILDNRVQTSYDASVLINYLLSTLNFRRHYFNGKHKAYKKCLYCNSRDKIKRYLDTKTASKMWLCENCYLNTDTGSFVWSKPNGSKEMKVELHDHNRNQELTSAQEDLICEHREQ